MFGLNFIWLKQTNKQTKKAKRDPEHSKYHPFLNLKLTMKSQLVLAGYGHWDRKFPKRQNGQV